MPQTPTKPKHGNDIPDMESPPAPDIMPGDPDGLRPVSEPVKEKPQRASAYCTGLGLSAIAVMLAMASVSLAATEDECEAIWAQSDANENGILEGDELSTLREEPVEEDDPPMTKPQFMAECFQEPSEDSD